MLVASGCCCCVAALVFWSAVDASVGVVVSEVPGFVWVDEGLFFGCAVGYASPAVGAALLYCECFCCASAFVVWSVAALCGGGGALVAWAASVVGGWLSAVCAGASWFVRHRSSSG